jgi:hypothetical protein
MKSNRIALLAALALAIAAPAGAASAPALTAGGNTLAGPGTTNLGLNATATVYTDDSNNSDTCVTVANTGKSPVRLTMVNDVPSTVSIDLAIGASGALCRDNTERVDLVCLGASTCSAQWRVDRD